jgi:hypothetical protein
MLAGTACGGREGIFREGKPSLALPLLHNLVGSI